MFAYEPQACLWARSFDLGYAILRVPVTNLNLVSSSLDVTSFPSSFITRIFFFILGHLILPRRLELFLLGRNDLH